MQRYFVEPHQIRGTDAVITGDDVHHIATVMRGRRGDSIIVCDGQGRTLLARLSDLSANCVRAEIVGEVDEHRELPVRVTIGQGLPKGDKMEWIVQKGTELGAHAFLPFASERSVVKLDDKKAARKVERWQKIAKEAAEQAHRSVLPAVGPLFSFSQLLEAGKNYTRCAIAYERADGADLRGVFTQLVPGDSLLVLIGPEGGFSEREAEMARAAGFAAVSLGPRILRTETAGMYVLSAASYHFESINTKPERRESNG